MAACLASFLTGCLTEPQAPRTPQATATEDSRADRAVVAFRVALPESAVGRVDSAALRMRTAEGAERTWPLAVRDSVLEAELRDAADAEKGAADIEVFAYARGELAYYGKAVWDPSADAAAQVSVTVGPVGRVRIEGRFEEGGIDSDP